MVLSSLPPGGRAVVIGSRGGIGAALVDALSASGRFAEVLGFGRHSEPRLDLRDEASMARVATLLGQGGPLRLVLVATGVLHGTGLQPEKSWRELDPTAMAEAFAVNAFGPALLMKHLLPLLARDDKAIFAVLSAKVGSIGDNRLGGWYSYRASKAALNQFIRTASIELARRCPRAVCVALHPGTVATALSAPFAKSGLTVHTAPQAAQHLLAVLDQLGADDSGGFFAWDARALPF